MIKKTNKRITLTIPKDYDYLIMKAKKYAYGESMSTSNLFLHLLLAHLLRENYISEEQYKQEWERLFDHDK